MSRPQFLAAFLFVSLSSAAFGQEAISGISVPVTVSGNARYSGFSEDSGDSALNGGFRALAAPRLQLGQHWFAYGVVGLESSNYWPYAQGWDNGNPVRFDFLQAYLGYEKQIGSTTVLVKGGRLSSAFGRFPLEYDDAKTSLVLPPAAFIANLPLRPDQLPCGVKNIIWQDYDGPVSFNCGGSTAERYGTVPVSLYGIPGVETQLSWKRLDARVQMTNSSPANPQSLLSSSQSLQATVGAGYSLKAGLHVGASAFHGPWLESDLEQVVPGTDLNTLNASGAGVDVQWLSGHWAVQGEWHRFHFSLPGFVESPSTQDAYAEVRRIISPRTYVAFRSSFLIPGKAIDATHKATPQIDSHQQVYETVFGYRINRLQLLKMGFVYADRNEWTLGNGYWPQERTWTFECQLVTSFSGLSKAFR